MKLSIVIPAYNEEYVLADCLRSIEEAVASSSHEIEIIVVNNASTDKTSEVASSFKGVRVVDEPRKGIVWARKAGYQASTGTHIANIDADTIMPQEWLSTVFKEFTANPNLLALSGPYIYYDASAVVRALAKVYYFIGYVFDAITQKVFNKGGILQGGNYVMQREAFEKIGGFDTSIMFYGEDVDVAQRLRKVGKIKWTFKLPMYSSARRFAGVGTVKTVTEYVVNYFWITLFGKPFNSTYSDIRIKKT